MCTCASCWVLCNHVIVERYVTPNNPFGKIFLYNKKSLVLQYTGPIFSAIISLFIVIKTISLFIFLAPEGGLASVYFVPLWVWAKLYEMWQQNRKERLERRSILNDEGEQSGATKSWATGEDPNGDIGLPSLEAALEVPFHSYTYFIFIFILHWLVKFITCLFLLLYRFCEKTNSLISDSIGVSFPVSFPSAHYYSLFLFFLLCSSFY